MALGVDWVAVDCADPGKLGKFWAEALDYEVAFEDENEVLIGRKGTRETKLIFLKVPEGKTQKNRLHFDLRGDDQATEVKRLEGLGASRLDIGQGDVPWVVMADPEGNEFCVLRELSAEGKKENESEGWVFG
jgi:hypothetical protein